jgi:lauroyl/myristoyl acyltransferase
LSEAWRPVREAVDDLLLPETSSARGGLLYRAHRFLLGGGILYVAADGKGREAFRVVLPGAIVRIKWGWFVLRRRSGVPVFPVFSHLDGRTQVVTIHPPLPPPDPDPERDLIACGNALARLLKHYVRQFPEQCYGLTFRLSNRAQGMPRGGASPDAATRSRELPLSP